MTDPSKATKSDRFDELKKSTAPLVSVDSVSTTTATASSLKPPSLPQRPSSSSSWRSKLHIHDDAHSSSRRSKSAEPGKERWRDATLSEKERWKDWQKAKDKEQMRGSTVGFFTPLAWMTLFE
ncbi:uncharacterized protein ALTATR162_LOCUS8974 [Alternaria atra]|uniref:Uncharacterized protein n=1 Tax=Alternaria atra TaxID=119953 RepID=A0A8J2N8M6_9PLEO|nr:uncharacterized protein ALTATR162_LOCUS8974 [Alternaria atra]CAG5178983.1 unnamed protein product [Alternaria atra]